jgi:hypothetical protein
VITRRAAVVRLPAAIGFGSRIDKQIGRTYGVDTEDFVHGNYSQRTSFSGFSVQALIIIINMKLLRFGFIAAEACVRTMLGFMQLSL